MAPPNPLELLKQALATAATGDVAATKAGFDKAMKAAEFGDGGTLDHVMHAYATYLRAQREFPKAIQLQRMRLDMRRLAGRDRPGLIVDALLDLAITLRGAGENLEAEALLHEAIGLAESAPMPGALLANALTYLSLHHLERKEFAKELALLERAVKSCPSDIDARRHYADVLWRRGERMEAVTQISEALRLSPGEVALCLDGGRMYMELGLLDDADRLADEAVAVAPGSAAAWHLRGQVAVARGRADEALADFHRALAIEPDDRDVLLDTAEVYRRLGRPQRSLATLAILGETYGPNQTPAHVLALEGMAQEALGRPHDALESYRQAVARGGTTPDLEARMAALAAPAADGAGIIRR